ncbi:hypothetical protein, partial [Bacillus cereus]
KLFCTSDIGRLLIPVPPNISLNSKQNIATLEICQENCSEILHQVCGVVSTRAIVVGAGITTIFINLTFRIINEFGEKICQHTYNFAKNVTLPANTSVTVDFPFCFQCCDTPQQCESNTIYRLEVSGESTEALGVEASIIRDTSWTAIVWENC